MNIHNLYQSGISKTRTRIFMNPIRRIMFKLLRPYFYQLIEIFNRIEPQEPLINHLKILDSQQKAVLKEFEKIHDRFNLLEVRQQATRKELEAMSHRFNTIESLQRATVQDFQSTSHRLNTIEQKIHDQFCQIKETQENLRTASFSQIGEDRIVAYIFERIGIELANIKYLDIGSALPIGHNNTYFFYQHGATGCLVEADPTYFESYKAKRPRDIAINAAIVPSAIAKESATVNFYRASDPGWSTASTAHLDVAKKMGKANNETSAITVPALDLEHLLNIIDFSTDIDLLSIDIEGFDISVIEDVNFSLFRPKVIICENNFDSETNAFMPFLQPFLEKQNYSLYASTHVNSIFVENSVLSSIKY